MFDERSLNHLFRYCLSLSDERDTAYDLLHDAIEKYFGTPERQTDEPLESIKHLIRNRFIDLQRRRNTMTLEVVDDFKALPSIEQELLNQLSSKRAAKAVLRKLNPLERETVFLWAVEGLSANEISESLDTPRSTILARLRRLKTRLASEAPSQQTEGSQ